MPGRATRRMLQRSIIQPITGTIMALTMPPTERANEAVPRCQPISAMIGFKNTPNVKASTGPLQTHKPVTAPPTTHHGLVNLKLKLSSRRWPGLAPGLPGILSRRTDPGQSPEFTPVAGLDPATHVFPFMGHRRKPYVVGRRPAGVLSQP